MNNSEYIKSLIKKAAYGINNPSIITILHQLAEQNHVSPTAFEALHGAATRQANHLIRHVNEHFPEVAQAYQRAQLQGKVPSPFPIRNRGNLQPGMKLQRAQQVGSHPAPGLDGHLDGHLDGASHLDGNRDFTL